jgi:hypothetical protein
VGDVAAGEGGVVEFAVVVDAVVPAGLVELSNTALIVDDGVNGEDPTPADNVASVVTSVVAAPDLVIEKSDVVVRQPGESGSDGGDADRGGAGRYDVRSGREHHRLAMHGNGCGK